MKKPTIKEVAQRAGVSIGSVSNVLHGRRVKGATRERVIDAIEALGYRPDTIAQSLIARRSRPVRRGSSGAGVPRLSTVGYISVDYIARIDVLPHRNDRVTASSIDRALGGPAANVAVYAAGLGGPHAVESELITALGFDADSEWALAELLARGVSTFGIDRRHGNRLSRCLVLLEAAGNRTIINEPFELAATDISRYLGRTESVREAGDRHGLHVEGYQVPVLRDSIAEARARGVLTSMHAPGLPGEWQTLDGLRALAGLFDLMFLNRQMAERVVGGHPTAGELVDRLDALLYRHAGEGDTGWLVLTLDAEGAVLLRPGEAAVHAAAPTVRVLDLTGAGDALAGVFLAVWLNGTPPAEALRCAVAAASRAITVEGGQGLRLDHEGLASAVAASPEARALPGPATDHIASTGS